MRAAPDDVVALVAVEFDNAEFRLVPDNTVPGSRIAYTHLPVVRRPIGFAVSLFQRHTSRGSVHDEGAVPALVQPVLLIIDDIGVEVVETWLPGLVFTKERIILVLPYGADGQFGVARTIDHS